VWPELLVTAVLGVQVAAPAQPSADDVGRAYYHFLQARVADGQNDVSEAIENYRQAIALLPGSAPMHLDLAELYVRQNQMAEAEREVRAALALDPANRAAHRLLGGIQGAAIERSSTGAANEATIAEAISHLERSLDGPGVDPPAEYLLNSLYVRKGEPARAVERLRALLKSEPENAAALRLLVKAHEALGQGAEADQALDTLADVRPDAIEMRVRQIGRLERIGRWADAAEAWSQVVSVEPASTIYRPRHAAALANSGNVADARTVIGAATRELPRSPSAWYLTALVEGQAGNLAAADAAVARLTEIDPADGRAPLAAARARAAAGDLRGVVQALAGRVSRPNPRDVSSGLLIEMADELSAAYVRLKQPGRSVEVYETARKHAPDNQRLLFSLAAAYETDRKYDRAERAFREIIQANESHAPALNYLGYMLADRGQKLPEALEFVKRALAIDEDNPAYLDSLGWTFYRMGAFDEARAPLERAAKQLPKVSVINDHLGDLYLQLKRYDEAAEAFERALSGDREGVEPAALEKKRDRARQLAAQSGTPAPARP
jgi:tetratricopeptide (TPR) repeat protein